jgi:sugar phosphate isomerase/epimerase
MRKKIVAAAVLAAGLSAVAAVPYKLGVAGYMFAKGGLDWALTVMHETDCRYLCHKDFMLPYTASDAQIAAFKAKLAKKGISSLATGPLYATDEASVRAQFEFAKRYGMKVVVGVPFDLNPKKGVPDREKRLESDRVLDIVDKLVKEYDICYAIHNHGPDNAFLFPTAVSALKRIGGRDKRIGVCLDVGHEARAGSDPVAFIRQHGARIYDVHIKNIKIDARRNLAVEGPRGDLDVPGILKALAEVGYEGVCHIEFEKGYAKTAKGMASHAMGLAESIGYYRGCMDSVRVKAPLEPVPAAANTLTAAEKADGWRLLWDGKTLNGWVGVKEKCQRPPRKGWKIEAGALSMLPVACISDSGVWTRLPPEDVKLGGGGDIVTVKKYRDFIFKFDFRMTEKANSGVKYFFDETANRGSCEEYQILDAGHPDFAKGRNGNRQCAALYDLLPAPLAKTVLRPVGKWNHGMIVSKGQAVEHWLNGVKVLEYTRGNEAFRRAVDVSKYKTWGTDGRRWGELPEGRLLLQDHSDSFVSYCNLKIKEL